MLNTAATAVAQPATGIAALAWLMIFIPLASSLFLLVAGRATNKWGHWLGVLASWASFLIGAATLYQVYQLPAESGRALTNHVFTWAAVGDLQLDVSLLLDPLSLTFVMLVTFVGSLIHVYAVAYMEHDAARRRFFAYLNLFIAAMLTLVLGDSYLLLFFGWEGVGLASYLLIGFWNHVPEYATAAKKAFVMNRVGDLGLLLAMMSMVAFIGSVQYDQVLTAAASGGITTQQATMIGLFLLVAACGKSAQFPLQAWLGDAMAGPTPVSALIHAATMVTAGVYLMVRSGALYVAAPTAMLVVAIIGAITLLFGAVVGCAKDDMKKVLAASTMSQIGYMMLAAGLGPIGWTFAIFHLLTHGFFKAQMFLGAGSVMHAMGDQVNMRRFGGLSKVMRITWITFAIGWLAILGVPPFSGYFSKDKIIEAAFDPSVHGEVGAWIFGLITLIGAGITAFYMSRLFFMTFHGEKRWTTEAEGAPVHPHESPALMTLPMIILSVFSIGLGGLLTINGAFENWLHPVFAAAAGHEIHHPEPVLPIIALQALTLALIAAAVVLAYLKYGRSSVDRYVPQANSLVVAARNDLYQDAFNEKAFMIPGMALTATVGAVDRVGVDGGVTGLASGALGLGKLISKTQTGYLRSYAAYVTGGVILALATVLGVVYGIGA